MKSKQSKKLCKQVDNLQLEIETLTATVEMCLTRQSEFIKTVNTVSTNAKDCIADIKATLSK